MNCRPENYFDFIGARLRDLYEVARIGLNENDRRPARNNFLQLVRAHPEIAKGFGFSEDDL